MSALALVTGRLAPGVWRGDATPSADLVALAEGLGWPVLSGRLRATEDKVAFLSELGAIASVPDYVRPNWDALADGLRDTDISSRRLLVIDAEQPTSFDALAIEVLSEAVAYWAAQGATMQVVWYGLVDAPRLDQVDPVKRSRS